MMIFVDKYIGETDLLHKSEAFKEFKLQDPSGTYTSRSLKLIYDMYCRWLNTTHGIGILMFHLSIPNASGECSESVLNNLFHIAQNSVKDRNTGSDNSIGMISKTYQKALSAHHEGCFLIPISDDGKNDKSKTLLEIFNIPSKVFAANRESLNTESSVYFSGKGKFENYGIIPSDANIDVHEQGFNILCEIAQLSASKADIEHPLLRTRYGYNPNLRSFDYSLAESLLNQTYKIKV